MQSNKFWAGGDSSDSEEESTTESEEEELIEQKIPINVPSRWDISDSDSDDDEKRVALSKKQKNYESLNTILAQIRHHVNIKDWTGLVDDMSTLDDQINEKLKTFIITDGIPKRYIQCLTMIDDVVEGFSKSDQKQLQKIASRAFVKVKQNIKKVIQGEILKMVEECRANPEAFEETVEENKENVEEEEKNESDEWSTTSDEESSDDEDENVVYKSKRDKWTLKPKDIAEMEKEKKGDKKEKREIHKTEEHETAATSYDYGLKQIVVTTAEELLDVYCKTMENRGKKTNKVEQIMILTQLYISSQQFAIYYQIMTALGLATVITEFHKDPDAHLSVHLWRRAVRIVSRTLSLLIDHPQLELELTYEFETKVPDNLTHVPVPLMPSLILDRLMRDYFKSLKNIDSASADYTNRLPDELPLTNTLFAGVTYYKQLNKPEEVSQLSLLIIELRYYKHSDLADEQNKNYTLYQIFGDPLLYHPASNTTTNFPKDMKQDISNPAAWGRQPNTEQIPQHDWTKEIEELAQYIHQFGNENSKQRSILSLIYYYSIHDKFSKARDLLLLSQLQTTISVIVPSTPDDFSLLVLYNRALTQLGLSAFRIGDHISCMNCLISLFFPKGYKQKAKELLAQGINYKTVMGDKSSDEIKQEKRRLLPSIQHISLDLIEVAYFISCMITMIPSLSSTNYTLSGINDHYRCFTNHLMGYEKRLFVGPAENPKDCVMYASISLRDGDWIEANNAIQHLSLWNLFKYNQLDQFKTNMTMWIKDTALQTYVLNCSGYYDSLSLDRLQTLFDLPADTIHSIISKMMVDGLLLASWDQTTNTVLFHRKEPSKLQSLSFNLTGNLNYLVSANEILYESRFGNSLFDQNRFYRKTMPNRDNRTRNNMNSAMNINRNRINRYPNDRKKLTNQIPTTNPNRWSETTYY